MISSVRSDIKAHEEQTIQPMVAMVIPALKINQYHISTYTLNGGSLFGSVGSAVSVHEL